MLIWRQVWISVIERRLTLSQFKINIGRLTMNVLTFDEKTNHSAMSAVTESRVIFRRIRTLTKIVITLLIVIGFLNTAMSSSDIYFTLASMIWLWQSSLVKIEFSIFNQIIRLVKPSNNKSSYKFLNLVVFCSPLIFNSPPELYKNSW